ncbi:Golgi-associated plant pathogenesis-related protein 1 isoform X1 [Macrotis lagotis]|uniref:Golgi-associated plant pathogenesis-related protein 1 isoform X1 n=1 Tax=Macrotis lagotis TaxID=92651 RepID=UPI003D681919
MNARECPGRKKVRKGERPDRDLKAKGHKVRESCLRVIEPPSLFRDVGLRRRPPDKDAAEEGRPRAEGLPKPPERFLTKQEWEDSLERCPRKLRKPPRVQKPPAAQPGRGLPPALARPLRGRRRRGPVGPREAPGAAPAAASARARPSSPTPRAAPGSAPRRAPDPARAPAPRAATGPSTTKWLQSSLLEIS